MGHTQTIAPVRKAVELEDLKLHLREEQCDLDKEIEWKLDAATQSAEAFTKRQFINATFDQTLDRFPPGNKDIVLFRSTLSSVTQIQYQDENDATQTLATTVYAVDTTNDPGRVYLKQGQAWPATAITRNTVTITYVAGYGAQASTVPAPVRDAVARLTAHLHDQEGVAIIGTNVAELPFAFQFLLRPYQVPWFPQ